MELTESHPPRTRGTPRWPLLLIGSPAAVAIWGGWVALGGMCGFGFVNLLPGIGHGFHLNTAITLPVGVEAYGAYALGVWLAAECASPAARRFARRSAIGSLSLGILGQVAYHLLAAAHRTRAPWPVVVAVSCIPVAVLGFAASLTHLLRAVPAPPAPVPAPYPAEPEPPSPDAELGRLLEWLTSDSNAVPGVPELHQQAAQMFAADVLAGRVPGIRAIRSGLRVGQDKATEVQAYLRTLHAEAASA